MRHTHRRFLVFFSFLLHLAAFCCPIFCAAAGENTVASAQPLFDYFVANPTALTVLLCAFFLLIILILLFVATFRRQKIEQQKNFEMQRFVSYVCAVNEYVFEMDAEKKTLVRYFCRDGKITHRQKKVSDAFVLPMEVFEEDRARLQKNLNRESLTQLANEGGQIYEETRFCPGKNGVFQWYALSVIALPKDEEHPQSFMFFCRNIHEAKAREEEKTMALRDALFAAQGANAAKTSFMFRVSHEIRTPLNALIGYISLARTAVNREKTITCLDKAEISAKELLNLVGDVLDLSSMENGKLKIGREELDLRTLLSNLAEQFREPAQERNLRFEIRLNSIVHEKLLGDNMRLNQILTNLLSNSFKFTKRGDSVTLTVTELPGSTEQLSFRFEIADTGIGMDKPVLDALFAPLEQQNPSFSRNFGAKGLGIAITQNLVSLMGGTIHAQSEPGEGSVFCVELPFQQDPSSGISKTIPPEYAALKVLVADGEETTREYFLQVFKKIGIDCTLVSERKDAHYLLHQNRYDLCLIGKLGTQDSGLDLLEELSAGEIQQTRFVLFGEVFTPEAEQRATALGVKKTLKLPVFASAVMDLLVDIFGKYSPKNPDKDVTAYRFDGKRILLAEDNEMNLEIAEDLLKSVGFEVVAAHNGKEALELFQSSEKGAYCAILMDIQMPLLGGYEAASLIRQGSHPDAEDIPIIALTASAFAEDVSEALSSGMNDHIAKPVDVKVLFETLSRYVSPS